jgi:putative mRNA 3-end processing factor
MPHADDQVPPRLDVEYWHGIHLVDSVLWLDAPRAADLCFISNARAGKRFGRARILTTAATARLAGPALESSRTLLSPTLRRFTLGGLDLELLPAGHLLGAAQLSVRLAGERLVYTGPIDPEPGLTRPGGRIAPCDVLVLACGPVRPGDRWPGRRRQHAAVVDWVERMLAAGGTPVLLAEPLGAAQEVAALLGRRGFRLRVHRSAYQHCRNYHALGVELPGVRVFRGTPGRDEVCLFPPALARSRAVDRLSRARIGLVGPAEHAPAAARAKAERVFGLSDWADHPALERIARESRARRIHLVGRHATGLAEALRARGLVAWPLRPPEQLDLFGAEPPAS